MFIPWWGLLLVAVGVFARRPRRPCKCCGHTDKGCVELRAAARTHLAHAKQLDEGYKKAVDKNPDISPGLEAAAYGNADELRASLDGMSRAFSLTEVSAFYDVLDERILATIYESQAASFTLRAKAREGDDAGPDDLAWVRNVADLEET